MTDSEIIAQEIIKLLFKADRCGIVSPRDFARLIEVVSMISIAEGTSEHTVKGIKTLATPNGNAVSTVYEDVISFQNGNQIAIKAVDKVITVSLVMAPATSFKFIQKGFGNTNLQENEVGDIFCGWTNNGLIRYTEAIYQGGPTNDSNNFIPLTQTEI